MMPDAAALFPEFTIVLPCYNPAVGWAEAVVMACQQLEANYGLTPHIILVNDGSRTDVRAGIELLRKTLPSFSYAALRANTGKGAAVRHGLALATTSWILYTDVDLPYTSDSLYRILEALHHDDCDVAVGVKDAVYYAGVPRGRRIISKVLRHLTSTLLRLSVTDTQCGLKGIKRSALKYFLRGRIDRYLFDLEALYRAERGGAQLVTVPVTLRPGIVFSRVRPRLLLAEVGNFLRILASQPR